MITRRLIWDMIVGDWRNLTAVILGLAGLTLIGLRMPSMLRAHENYAETREERKEKILEAKTRTIRVAYNKPAEYTARVYARIFTELTEDAGLPWTIPAAVTWIESRYDPTARMSETEASGLMQLRPETAKIQAKKLNLPYDEKTLWTDVDNIQLGISYLLEAYTNEEGATEEERIRGTLRGYVAGLGYRNVRMSQKATKYMRWYENTVYTEYVRLEMIYKGVRDALGL